MQEPISEKLKNFLLDEGDLKLAKKLSSKYNLSDDDFVNLSFLIYVLITKKENLEEKNLDELISKYLGNLSEEVMSYLKKDIILEVIPLISELWKEENKEETYEEREKRYLEMMKILTETPLIKSEKEEKEEFQKIIEEKEEKLTEKVVILEEQLPVFSWNIQEPKEEKENLIPLNEETFQVEIKIKKEDDKKNEDTIDLSQV